MVYLAVSDFFLCMHAHTHTHAHTQLLFKLSTTAMPHSEGSSSKVVLQTDLLFLPELLWTLWTTQMLVSAAVNLTL